MEAKIKQLQQKQKAEERNKRTHRICTRGGMMEGMLPDTVKLTDEQFRVFNEYGMGFGYRMVLCNRRCCFNVDYVRYRFIACLQQFERLLMGNCTSAMRRFA